ncbi:MAG: hypothetical protein JSS86_14920 [Cyanobacteria bacterium SZAS LIN-2]|nr:hypothetical protein [Cyanobacteria bacterium SZAS LIN-2]
MLSKNRALKEFIERHIKEGFLQRDEIIAATIVEFRGEFGGADFYQAVAATVDKYLARYLIMESGWVTATDCDKLDKAFSELERRGILARQHFACCNDCGHQEMQSEVRRVVGSRRTRKRDRVMKAVNQAVSELKGFAFFHQQDTQRAIKQGTLFLTFDSIERNVEKAVEVGATVVEVLKDVGLVVSWNGSYLQRIAVTKVSWRKRRFSAMG